MGKKQRGGRRRNGRARTKAMPSTEGRRARGGAGSSVSRLVGPVGLAGRPAA